MRSARALCSGILAVPALALLFGSLGMLASAGSVTKPSRPTGAHLSNRKAVLTGRRGGTLMLAGAYAGARTFNPLIVREGNSGNVIDPLFDGLVRRDLQTLAIEPALAKSWDVSVDRRTWTFHLRDGLRWSDGQPVMADDVTFTMDLIHDPKVDTALREVLMIDGKPLRYARVDTHTVRVTLPAPFGPFLAAMDFPILPKHKLEKPWKAGTFNSTWGVDTPPGKLVGTGPFVLASYAGGEKALYRRNPYYWRRAGDGRPLPFVDNRILQFVADQNALLLKFRAGELDGINVRAEDWATVRKNERAGGYHTLNLGPSWTTHFIAFNWNPRATRVLAYKREWFAKKEFRQAVSYALNRPSMIDTIYRGLARPLWSPVSEANRAFFNPRVRQYPYHPAKAQALLKGLGFVDRNGDGIREDRAGHELAFTLLTTVSLTQGIARASIIQADLKQVGIRVTVSPLELNALTARVDNTHDWECVQLSFSGDPDPHGAKSNWMSSGYLHLWNPRQAKPATPWEAEIDRIFSTAAKLNDVPQRKALYDRWQMIVSEQLPLIFLVTPDVLVAIRDRVQNARPVAFAGGGLFWNREELAVREIR